MTMFVISRNGGPEGYSPPLLAVNSRDVALVALEFLRASGDTLYELFEVPEWPKAPNKWWDTKPLEPT